MAGGETEDRAAYAADAFARMVTGQGKGRAARADVVFACDYRAYQRGHAHEGEVCHIIGGGPVPVSVVREIAKDAFLKVAFHDGVEIQQVAHFGRHRPAELETALGLGAPPDFAGVTCCEPGCERRYGLEWDHVDPVANEGPTSFENLSRPLLPPPPGEDRHATAPPGSSAADATEVVDERRRDRAAPAQPDSRDSRHDHAPSERTRGSSASSPSSSCRRGGHRAGRRLDGGVVVR